METLQNSRARSSIQRRGFWVLSQFGFLSSIFPRVVLLSVKRDGGFVLPMGSVSRVIRNMAQSATKASSRNAGLLKSTKGDVVLSNNIWLIGTAMSLFFGFLGAWIVLVKVPSFGAH